jgi:hypothetical protein
MGERFVDSFSALDPDGNIVWIDIFEEISAPLTHRGHADPTPGRRVMRTRDGQHVNPYAKGEYQVMPSGVILRSDSPDAP